MPRPRAGYGTLRVSERGERMADSGGIGHKLEGIVDRAKEKVGRGDQRTAADAEGRIELVRDALRAFGQGDFDGFVEGMDEEVEWLAPAGEKWPGGASLEGREQIREEFVDAAGRSYVSFGFQPDNFLENEDEEWVLVIGAFFGEGVKGEGEFTEPAVLIWEFANSKVAKVRIFTDSDGFAPVVTEEEEKEEEESDDEDEGSEGSGGSSEGDDSEDEDSDDHEGASARSGGEESEGESDKADEEGDTDSSDDSSKSTEAEQMKAEGEKDEGRAATDEAGGGGDQPQGAAQGGLESP